MKKGFIFALMSVCILSCNKDIDSTQAVSPTNTNKPKKFIEINSPDTIEVLASRSSGDYKTINAPGFTAYSEGGEVLDKSKVSIWYGSTLHYNWNYTYNRKFEIPEINNDALKNFVGFQYFVYDVDWGSSVIKRDSIFVKLVADTTAPILDKVINCMATVTGNDNTVSGPYPRDPKEISFRVRIYKNGTATITPGSFIPKISYSGWNYAEISVFCPSIDMVQLGLETKSIGGESYIDFKKEAYSEEYRRFAAGIKYDLTPDGKDFLHIKGSFINYYKNTAVGPYGTWNEETFTVDF